MIPSSLYRIAKQAKGTPVPNYYIIFSSLPATSRCCFLTGTITRKSQNRSANKSTLPLLQTPRWKSCPFRLIGLTCDCWKGDETHENVKHGSTPFMAENHIAYRSPFLTISASRPFHISKLFSEITSTTTLTCWEGVRLTLRSVFQSKDGAVCFIR